MKDLVDPILKAGGWLKENPLPGAADWGAMEGLVGGAGEPVDPAPKVNTPGVLFVAVKPLLPPN